MPGGIAATPKGAFSVQVGHEGGVPKCRHVTAWDENRLIGASVSAVIAQRALQPNSQAADSLHPVIFYRKFFGAKFQL